MYVLFFYSKINAVNIFFYNVNVVISASFSSKTLHRPMSDILDNNSRENMMPYNYLR